MSLISVLEQLAGKLQFNTEEERTAIHEQIHALGDEAVTDVRSLVHGVEEDAAADISDVFAHRSQGQDPGPQQTGGSPVAPGAVTPPDPLADVSVDDLEAEIARRKAAQQ